MIEDLDPTFRSKYHKSREIIPFRPDYQAFAKEANEKFGQDLPDDTKLEDIYQLKGVVLDYVIGLLNNREGRHSRFALKSFVGIANRVGIQTVGEVRKMEEKELRNLILEKLGNHSQYKLAPIYLKNLFHTDFPQD
ncbi:MAG: hypothetical protein Q7R97_02095 [Candidatus Daviesbacteria bacterium]|nr:hypothetical protein [Candidatus Daviesbacteria bacterium]